MARYATRASIPGTETAYPPSPVRAHNRVEMEPFLLDPKTVDLRLPTNSPLLTLAVQMQKTRHSLRSGGP